MTDSYQPWVPPKRGFYVYRAWAGGNHSLYVGMVGTKGPAYLDDRLRYHEMCADWWPEVARVDWAEFASTKEARAEETRQIATQVPVYNKVRPKPKEIGGATAPARPIPAPSPPPSKSAIPQLPRPPRDVVSDAEFAEWPYWIECDRGWKRFCNDATGPPPGERWHSYPRGSH